jgi:acid stress chaperone HdeA
MKTRSIFVSAALAAALGNLLVALPAKGGEKKQADQITCEDFLKMAPASQERIAYWVNGYQHGQGNPAVEVIEFDKFGQPIGEIVEDCKAAPKETLWQKLKKHL